MALFSKEPPISQHVSPPILPFKTRKMSPNAAPQKLNFPSADQRASCCAGIKMRKRQGKLPARGACVDLAGAVKKGLSSIQFVKCTMKEIHLQYKVLAVILDH